MYLLFEFDEKNEKSTCQTSKYNVYCKSQMIYGPVAQLVRAHA